MTILLSVLRISLYALVLCFIFVPEVSEPSVTYETYSNYVPRYFAAPIHHVDSKQTRCLAQAIYYEAGNQSVRGKETVALVILNRVNDKRYPRTICGVVHQSHLVRKDYDEDTIVIKRVCQFSFWCEDLKHPVKETWMESYDIAKRVLRNYWEREIITTMNNAMYFHAEYVKPKWRKDKIYLGKVGKHLFYAEKSKQT